MRAWKYFFHKLGKCIPWLMHMNYEFTDEDILFILLPLGNCELRLGKLQHALNVSLPSSWYNDRVLLLARLTIMMRTAQTQINKTRNEIDVIYRPTHVDFEGAQAKQCCYYFCLNESTCISYSFIAAHYVTSSWWNMWIQIKSIQNLKYLFSFLCSPFNRQIIQSEFSPTWSCVSLTRSTTSREWKLFRFDKKEVNCFQILLIDVTFYL